MRPKPPGGMSTISPMSGATVAVAASTTVRRDDDTLFTRTRRPSGVTATPVLYGAIRTVAATAFVSVRMMESSPLDAAKTRAPSLLEARSVGGLSIGMLATTAAGTRGRALGALPPMAAQPARHASTVTGHPGPHTPHASAGIVMRRSEHEPHAGLRTAELEVDPVTAAGPAVERERLVARPEPGLDGPRSPGKPVPRLADHSPDEVGARPEASDVAAEGERDPVEHRRLPAQADQWVGPAPAVDGVGRPLDPPPHPPRPPQLPTPPPAPRPPPHPPRHRPP